MPQYNTLRTFKRARFTIRLDWHWEDYPDLSFDETGETQEKVASGEWGVYTFQVTCYCDGREIATDYLGNSIYADPAEFAREHIGVNRYREQIAPAVTGTYFTDMVHTVIKETRETLCNAPKVRCV